MSDKATHCITSYDELGKIGAQWYMRGFTDGIWAGSITSGVLIGLVVLVWKLSQ